MRLNLKTKSTLAISLLVLAVVSTLSALYLGRLTQQTLRLADDRAGFVAQQIYNACGEALDEAAERGDAPASQRETDMHDYVRRAFDNGPTLNSLIESDLGYSATIYDILITDRDGIVLISSDAATRGEKVAARPAMTSLVRTSFAQKLRVLYGPPQTYEYSLPFNIGPTPFGDIRVGLSSALIRDEISPALNTALYWAIGSVLLSTLLAFGVSWLVYSPIARISAQLDRISAGEFDAEPAVQRTDELGLVSTKISGIGQQLRHVREVFSDLRENLNQVMAGLGNGILLFNEKEQAVLVSPAVEEFLGANPAELQGRSASEIFPPGHPMHEALRMDEANEIEPVEGKEVLLPSANGPRRASVSALIIREQGRRMGTLVTLQDVESIERIGSQLQVSERLAALGRVTAGVAHEVKNPLNSMRLWLEVLKANMPVSPEPQQAVKMLDNEIDRLDRAVKTFLNFTRPVELQFEETDLRALLQEIADAARPSIVKAGVVLRVELPEEFPTLLVDRQLIHQAVLNLLVNASEFTSRGGSIGLSLGRRNDCALISVADSGKGIPLEEQKKIFQLFHTTRPGGTGIGLANAFRFVQLHNGQIEFESELGHGATFRIELPLARHAEPAIAGTSAARGQLV